MGVFEDRGGLYLGQVLRHLEVSRATFFTSKGMILVAGMMTGHLSSTCHYG